MKSAKEDDPGVTKKIKEIVPGIVLSELLDIPPSNKVVFSHRYIPTLQYVHKKVVKLLPPSLVGFYHFFIT